MTEQETEAKQPISVSAEGKPRVFARQLARPLAQEELEKISGGECHTTNYPRFDFECDI